MDSRVIEEPPIPTGGEIDPLDIVAGEMIVPVEEEQGGLILEYPTEAVAYFEGLQAPQMAPFALVDIGELQAQIAPTDFGFQALVDLGGVQAPQMAPIDLGGFQVPVAPADFRLPAPIAPTDYEGLPAPTVPFGLEVHIIPARGILMEQLVTKIVGGGDQIMGVPHYEAEPDEKDKDDEEEEDLEEIIEEEEMGEGWEFEGDFEVYFTDVISIGASAPNSPESVQRDLDCMVIKISSDNHHHHQDCYQCH